MQQHSAALHREDLLDIYSGYADIIAKMPANDAINALQTFCAPLLGQLQSLATNSGDGAKQDVKGTISMFHCFACGRMYADLS